MSERASRVQLPASVFSPEIEHGPAVGDRRCRVVALGKRVDRWPVTELCDAPGRGRRSVKGEALRLLVAIRHDSPGQHPPDGGKQTALTAAVWAIDEHR